MSWAEDLRRKITERWAPGTIFRLTQVYEFVPELQKMHPRNATVESSIRRSLQELRDSGDLDFVDNDGTYRRLR